MTREEAIKDFNRQRLAAMDRVRRDGRLSASIRTVGAELFSRLDFDTGDAYPSEEYLVEKLLLSPRTVKMAVKALQQAGYFVIRKVGRCNRYQPVFEAAEQVQNLPQSESQQVQNLPLSGSDRGKIRPEQVQKTSPNRCKKGPPTSLETSLGLLPGAAGSVGAPDGAAAPAYALGIAGERLRERLGDDVYASWLAKLRLVSETGEVLTLSAPSKFLANYIKTHFAEAIAKCWPFTGRLEIVVAQAVAPIARREAENPDARWLIDTGIGLVSDQLRIDRKAADRTLTSWLARCGNDAAGLRKIISDAAARELVGLHFREVVKRRTRELSFADQSALPLKLMAVKRTAS
jgi:hypothetical protein